MSAILKATVATFFALAGLTIPAAARGDWLTTRGDYERTSRSDSTLNPNELVRRWSSPEGYRSPLLVNGTVIAVRSFQSGTEPHLITGFDVNNGSVRWSAQEPGMIRAASALNGRIYYRVDQGNNWDLVVRSAATGQPLIHQNFPGSVFDETPLALRGAGPDAATCYFADGGAAAWNINVATGSISVQWTSTGGLSSAGDVVSPLTQDAIVSSNVSGAWMNRLTDGHSTTLFETHISGGGNVTSLYDTAHRRLFVGDPFGTIHAYAYNSAESATPLWTREQHSAARTALAANGTLFAQSSDGQAIIQIDPETGQDLQRHEVRVGGVAGPVIQGDYLWSDTVINDEPRMTAFDLATLTPVMSLRPENWESYGYFDAAGFDSTHMVVTMRAFDYQRFDVYAVPEPAIASAICASLLPLVLSRRWGFSER